ncbi:MAG: tRNA lysidine(34) synthetase TilS [Desulfuromonadaceae bacterium]|nr:tRNA lysidine(34) synthetase TilS [Desulfuromonadaceae bacterium]
MIFTDSALISRVAHTVREQRLFKPADTLVVGLSGGADSTALLDLLTRLPGYNLTLVAAHLNHGLRGAESDADEEFCRDLAERYAIAFEGRRLDIRALAAADRHNLEDAGRRARIAFFDEIRTKYAAAAVALAHHADDQAETVLMRLLRGSGMTGLSGMSYRNTRGYVRPLLAITRAEIEKYLRSCGLAWREDSTNSDSAYLRNRIRHQLLPLLEEYNPAIRSGLAATAEIIRGDESLLLTLTDTAFAESCRGGEGIITCSVARLRMFDLPLRRRVLRHAFKQLAGTLAGVSQLHVDVLCDTLNSGRPNAQLSLPNGVVAVREYEHLKLMFAGDRKLHTDFEFFITGPGSYPLPCGSSITIDAITAETFPTDSSTVHVDLNKTPFPWLVRTFRPGDRITPFGMNGSKKVKDIFIDRKIPPSDRRRIPLVYCGNDLVWIAGVCISELNRLGTDAHAVVKATYIRQ